MPTIERQCRVSALMAGVVWLACSFPARAGATDLPTGSLVIPMDLTYQDYGMLQAFGLVHHLLSHGIPVYRIINPYKISSAECASSPQGCWWDCETQGDGRPCPYPTFAPDLVTTSRVLWDDRGVLPPGTALPSHGYRGGPFVVHASDAVAARPVIDAWNDPSRWTDEPWAARSGFSVVSVHETTVNLTVAVGLELGRPPRMAILADSREDRFARVLRAAGIRQTDGAEFDATPCAPGGCGPGTARPDFLTPDSLLTRRDGCLRAFLPDLGSVLLDLHGNPRYALLAAGGWTVDRRDAIECGDGGPCSTTQIEDPYGRTFCFDEPIREHGHQLLGHLSSFFWLGGSLLFMGETAYTVENAVASYEPPILDPGEPGHYLTRIADWLSCPCEAGFTCVPDGCRRYYPDVEDCCIPNDLLLRQAGVFPGAVPDGPLAVTRPEHPVLQFDGEFAPTTGPLGWMRLSSGGVTAQIQSGTQRASRGAALLALAGERVTLLGDFDPGVSLPVSANPNTQVARLILDALFAARLPGTPSQEGVILEASAPMDCTMSAELEPVTLDLTVRTTHALELDLMELELFLPPGVTATDCAPLPDTEAPQLLWRLSRVPMNPWGYEPPEPTVQCQLTFERTGEHPLMAVARYTDGADSGALTHLFSVTAGPSPDTDGDFIPDCADPYPEVPQPCGDNDRDGYDDCTGEYDWTDDEGGWDEGGRHQDERSGLCPAAVGGRTRAPREPAWTLLMLLFLLRRRTTRGA